MHERCPVTSVPVFSSKDWRLRCQKPQALDGFRAELRTWDSRQLDGWLHIMSAPSAGMFYFDILLLACCQRELSDHCVCPQHTEHMHEQHGRAALSIWMAAHVHYCTAINAYWRCRCSNAVHRWNISLNEGTSRWPLSHGGTAKTWRFRLLNWAEFYGVVWSV